MTTKSARLGAAPGIGVLGGTALAAAVGQGETFCRGPAGVARLGAAADDDRRQDEAARITKRGNTHLRMLLIHGARAALPSLSKQETPLGQWLRGLLVGTHRNVVIVALAAVFSLGPLLLIVTSIAGLFFGRDAVKDALNEIWEVQPPKEGVWKYVRTYLISVASILGLGFLLAVSLIVTTALTAVSGWLGGGESAAWHVLNFLASLMVLGLLFGMLFKWFPDTEVPWPAVWPGALLTALLFNFSKMLIGLYIGAQGLESTHGAAASVVILLVWVYYSSQIVLFGAELTRAYARRGQIRSPTTAGFP